MSIEDTEHLFSLCDADNKGYLTVEDLGNVCPQLDAKDIAYIFKSLDTDGSGRIEKDEFCSGFISTLKKAENSGFNGMERRASMIGGRRKVIRRRNISSDSEDEEPAFDRRRLQEEVYHSESDTAKMELNLPCNEDVIALYEQLQHIGVPQLLTKFERVVGSLNKEFKQQKDENNRLQQIFENERDMFNRRLEEVETEIDQQVLLAEKKAREEECERLTREKEEMRQRMEAEMREMADNIAHLQKMEDVLEREGQKLKAQRELHDRIAEVSSENSALRRTLAENHVELAMIKSELAHVRSEYETKEREMMSEKNEILSKADESEKLQRQLELLFDANRKLHDTNDNLRGALDHRTSVFRQLNIPTPPQSSYSSRSLESREKTQTRSSLSPSEGLPAETIQVSNGDLSTRDGYTSSDLESEHLLPAVIPTEVPEENRSPERTFRIVMCGEAAVGKSSLVTRITTGVYSNNLPSTLGVDFHVKTLIMDGKCVALQLWDTAGQERFRSLCKSYFRRADGAILVYDVTAEQTFLRMREWVATIKVGN